jgi:uncharacterized protein YyaL (SSP411 family)
LSARDARVAPGRDDKVLAGWNGLMIRGLAFAARVFRRDDWKALATRAADGLLARLWRSGQLLRAYQDGHARIPGFIEDYGDVAAGLTSLYQATFESKYLEAADQIARRAVELFWDEERQAYLSAPKGQKDLLCPTYALHDNAFPSGASSLTEAQVALAALTGAPEHLAQAGRYLRKMAKEAARNPFAFGHLLLAADAFIDGAAEVVISAPSDERHSWIAAVDGAYAPTVALSARGPDPIPALLAEMMRGKGLVGGRPAAYVCRNFACDAPITDPAALRRALETLSNR